MESGNFGEGEERTVWRQRLFIAIGILFLAIGLLTAVEGIAWLAPEQPVSLPSDLLAELCNPDLLPKGHYHLVQEWEAETVFAHRIGRLVSDKQASGEAAWEVQVGADRPREHALFGPYVDLPPGFYVAFFRLKLLEPPIWDIVAEVDACVNYGRRILRSEEVADKFLSTAEYRQVFLPFHYEGGKLECRLLWHGLVSLRIDKVTLYRVEEADPKEFVKRAPRPIPSGEPKGLRYYTEPRPFPDLFPRSKAPSPHLVVVDLRPLPADWQLALLTLQGLVNRSRPQLYVLFNPTDEFWLAWLQKRGWVKSVVRLDDPIEVLQRFGSVVKGLIVYDPLFPATKNVATMLASVESGLPVSPRLKRDLDLRELNTSFPVLADLRGKWKTNAEAYWWAFDNLWARLNHHVVACSYPDHIGLRDYLVQHRIFTFWVTGPIDGARQGGDPIAEVQLMERLFERMPVNIPVMSYPWAGEDVGMGEGPGVTLFAEFGKFLVGSIDCTNLSVHSGIPVPKVRQKPSPPIPSLSLDKVYFTFIISDGDNLPVLTNSNFPQLWRSPVRGKLPLGWSISPAAILLIPAIVDYYYETATPNDCFVGAVSGVGYTYPDHYGQRYREPDRTRIFDEFLALTAQHMEWMDLRDLWVMGVSKPELLRRYAEKIPTLRSLFPDYGRRLQDPSEVTYPIVRNVPVFHAITGWREEDSREERIARMVDEIRAMTPQQRPAFLHAFVWNWGFDLEMLYEVTQRLGDTYVPVRPDHLAHLYRQWLAQQQLLVRTPTELFAVEGIPSQWVATLHNGSPKPLAGYALVTEGMQAVRVTPAKWRLNAGESLSLTITGIPTGEVLRWRTVWNGRQREHASSIRLIRRQELLNPLPKVETLQFAVCYQAEQLAHRIGAERQDSEALNGRVWEARLGEAGAGHLVFGPYAPLPAGEYLALFRLRRLDERTGVVATLDTCVGGGEPITASFSLSSDQLPVGLFRWVVLPFKHPGGTVETRVFWHGAVSLSVDAIVILKVNPTR